MSGLDLSQNILSLQAGANAGDVAQIGAEASVDFRGTAQLKRGIMLEAGVAAWAEAQAGFSKFLAADAEVRGEASARLRGQIQAPLDLFSESGVAIRLQAVAELALSAQLGIGLAIGDFIALAQEDPRIDGIYLTLLEIFLEELQIQAGVRGRVAYSAMAYLNLVVAGRLIEDDVNNLPPGFTIAMNCGAGLKGGGGWGLFANLGLENPRRLIRRSVDAVVDEVLAQVRDEMPDEASRRMVGLLRAPAKMALRGGFEVGLSLAENGPTFADSGPELARRCVSVILEEAQRFLLEQIAMLGVRLIEQGLESIGAGAAAWDASAAERKFLVDQLSDQPDDPFEPNAESLEYWSGVVNGAVGVGLSLGGGLIPDELVEAIALLWASAQLAFVTTQRVSDASARASFFGALSAEARIEAFQGQLVDQAPAPEVVRTKINTTLGRNPNAELRQDQLVEFLTATALDRLVAEFPDTAPFLEIVAGPDASPAALSAAASTILTNAGAFTPNPDTGAIDPETTLRALTGGLQAYIEVRVHNELAPLIHDAIDHQPDLGIYVDEVLLSTLDFTVETVFDRVLDWSFGNVGYREALKDACSSIVMKLLGRSLVVTTDVLVAYASEHVSEELLKLADDVDDPGGFGDQLAAATETDEELVGEVLRETLLICAEVFGPMPDEKRAKIRNLLYSVLDTVPASPDADWLDQLQTDLFIPDGEARTALLELGGEMSGMLSGYLQDFFTRVLTRLAEIALEEGAEMIEALVASVEAWVDELEAVLTALLIRLSQLPGEILAALNALNAQFDSALSEVQTLLGTMSSTPDALPEGLAGALHSPAWTALIDADGYVALPGWVQEMAADALDSAVEIAATSGLLSPVLQATQTAALQADAALEAVRVTLAELREIDPEANVTEQTLSILLDHVEDAVRAAFGDDDPELPISVGFTYTTPAIGIRGTLAYVSPQKIGVTIDLGEVVVPLDAIITIVRNAVAGLAVVEEQIAALVDALMIAFGHADTHAELTLERAAAEQQKPLLEAQLTQSCGSGLVGTLLSPQPGGVYGGDVPLDVHIARGCETLLGSGEIEQQRVFVFLNETALAVDRFDVEVWPEPARASNRESIGVTVGGRRVWSYAEVASRSSARAPLAARTRAYEQSNTFGRALSHSIQKQVWAAPSSTLPVHHVGRLHTRAERDADAAALGWGIRLRLSIPRAELHEGVNTLTLVVTNGRGETDQQALAFVAAAPAARVEGGPTLGERPDVAFNALPPELWGWAEEAGLVAVAAVGGDADPDRRKEADAPHLRENAFWIGTRRERSAGRTAARKQERAALDGTTGRLRQLRRAIEDRGLRPANRATSPSPARASATGPSPEHRRPSDAPAGSSRRSQAPPPTPPAEEPAP